MASSTKNLDNFSKEISSDLSSKVFAIVVSEWNDSITDSLYQGAHQCLLDHGVKEKNIITSNVPGSYELTYAAQKLAQQKKVDAIICLGCVIKGETKHDEYISHAVANGLTNVSLKYDKPVIFGLLTTNDLQQARERSGGLHGNKGTEAAYTAMRMLEV